jgi:hypothetical protein
MWNSKQEIWLHPLSSRGVTKEQLAQANGNAQSSLPCTHLCLIRRRYGWYGCLPLPSTGLTLLLDAGVTIVFGFKIEAVVWVCRGLHYTYGHIARKTSASVAMFQHLDLRLPNHIRHRHVVNWSQPSCVGNEHKGTAQCRTPSERYRR